MYKGLAVIFSLYFAGELVAGLELLPVPGNVLGMVFLLSALVSGVVKLEDVEDEAEYFIEHMGIMFIPPGVGVMVYFGLLRDEIIPIIVALVLSFIITVGVTGKVVEVLR